MSEQYSLASEPASIGAKLIKKYHEHLATRRVEFVFVERLDKDGQSQAIIKKGKNHYGQAKLVTGLNAFLGTHDLDFSEGLVTHARFKTQYIVEGGYLRRVDVKGIIPCSEEANLFEKLNLEWVEPGQRTGRMAVRERGRAR